MSEPRALHFLDRPIEALYAAPPAREKTPDCPNGFIWEGRTYRVTGMLSAWSDFTRRGSLNVGRFYFRVRVDTGQVFDLYYDRAMKSVDDRKGQWFVYRELSL